MTDKELLKLAAKAAGYPIDEGYFEESKNGPWWVYVDGAGDPPNDSAWTEIWNPLTDDGDKYRLAKKLEMRIDFDNCLVSKVMPDGDVIRVYWGMGGKIDDGYAITEVAAEIGKGMK